MKTHVMGLVALWSLVGCASLSYQEPLQGPRARVRFVTTSTAPTVLRAYDDANCAQNESEWMRLREGPLVNSQPKKLGMPMWNHHENAAKEVYVDASRPMHGMFFGQEPVGIGLIHACAVPFSFSFAENRDYEVKYHFIPKQCHVTISSIAPNGDGWVYKTAAKFGNRATEMTQGCDPVFRRLRWN
jgi:hypothetical protein